MGGFRWRFVRADHVVQLCSPGGRGQAPVRGQDPRGAQMWFGVLRCVCEMTGRGTAACAGGHMRLYRMHACMRVCPCHATRFSVHRHFTHIILSHNHQRSQAHTTSRPSSYTIDTVRPWSTPVANPRRAPTPWRPHHSCRGSGIPIHDPRHGCSDERRVGHQSPLHRIRPRTTSAGRGEFQLEQIRRRVPDPTPFSPIHSVQRAAHTQPHSQERAPRQVRLRHSS